MSAPLKGTPIEADPVPRVQSRRRPPAKPGPRSLSIGAVIVLSVSLFGCAIYANLAFAVTNPANFAYFPPFTAYNNANQNHHLGAEYFNIARAMVAGEGFANPFGEKTGPTAWMPPVLPTILAGLLWACDGNVDLVMAAFVFLQVYVIVFTGLLVLTLARRTTSFMGAWLAALVFFVWVCNDFHTWFQFTHDCWIVLLAMDILVAGVCWFEPFHSVKAASAWGVCGGLLAMINPAVALAWGVTSMILAVRQRSVLKLGVAFILAGLTVSPWIARNYAIFGRLIPVKSNAGYELWQSQVLMEDGLLQPRAFGIHPYTNAGRERQQYKADGEMAYLDKKSELFWKSVQADPLDFADRVATRFLGATLWYTPFERGQASSRPLVTKWERFAHPLPFLAAIFLIFSGAFKPLHRYQWCVVVIYFLYLLPYIGISYYERYAAPLLGVKALLVIWAIDRLGAAIFKVRQPA